MKQKYNHGLRDLVALLALAGFAVGCTGGGDTDGGSAADEDFAGEEFVDDASAGSIDLVITNTSVAVGQTTGFRVTVTDASGGPARQIPIYCDTEEGVAVIEPTTGRETTDSSGSISGIFGCERPGSFQVACRLPIGGNKRDFEDILCTGAVPAGFTGFPGAAGGGLGGGVSVQDPDDPNGSPGGGNLDNSVVVSDLDIYDVGSDPVFSIDSIQEPDCDGDSETVDPEPFVENAFTATIENDANQRVTFNTYQITVPGVYTSAQFPIKVEVDGNGGRAGISGLITTENPKVFFGSSSGLTSFDGPRTFRFTFRGTAEGGDAVTLTASVTVNITNINNCSSS